MGELAERESIRMPSATSLVDGLIKSDLVRRIPDSTDRRAVVVELTEHGYAVLRKVRAQRDDALSTALNKLSESHRSALEQAAEALEELRNQVEQL